MAHLDNGNKSRAGATPREWLGIGADIGEIANEWSGRDDLIAYVGDGAGGSEIIILSEVENKYNYL